MYILLGYARIVSHTPTIHIYGIFNNIDECIQRIEQLDTNITEHGDPWPSNVVHTQSYVFWYKEAGDLQTINTAVSNIP